MFVTRTQHEWFTLAVDETDRILRLRRSNKKVLSAEELTSGMTYLLDAIERIVPTSERPRWNFLQDMREAPLLNNPEWEAEQFRYVKRFRTGWRRSALLVQTPIGKLQARRMTSAVGVIPVSEILVIDDEIAALNFLRQPT
ncbi:MAG: hypothetical protein JNJ46_01945 [Myxococcales bacterium]|nr:hypothetical protein [Myxococcales bacterium]